jgi:hypothetical protein
LTTMILASRPTRPIPRQTPCSKKCSKTEPLPLPRPTGQKTSCYRACQLCGLTDGW